MKATELSDYCFEIPIQNIPTAVQTELYKLKLSIKNVFYGDYPLHKTSSMILEPSASDCIIEMDSFTINLRATVCVSIYSNSVVTEYVKEHDELPAFIVYYIDGGQTVTILQIP